MPGGRFMSPQDRHSVHVLKMATAPKVSAFRVWLLRVHL